MKDRLRPPHAGVMTTNTGRGARPGDQTQTAADLETEWAADPRWSDVTRDYTSARLRTEGVFDQKYGRFEARLKLPRGAGIWPAFWLLGTSHTTRGWPECGELDIMELRGSEPGINHGSAHGPGYSGGNPKTASYTLSGGGSFAEDFHVFAIEWSPGEVHWFVDGDHYHAIRAADMPVEQRWVFDDGPMFVILNVAVGGWFGGAVDDSVFPQSMYVDYVRVYARE